jgi:hypothetical protein
MPTQNALEEFIPKYFVHSTIKDSIFEPGLKINNAVYPQPRTYTTEKTQ